MKDIPSSFSVSFISLYFIFLFCKEEVSWRKSIFSCIFSLLILLFIHTLMVLVGYASFLWEREKTGDHSLSFLSIRLFFFLSSSSYISAGDSVKKTGILDQESRTSSLLPDMSQDNIPDSLTVTVSLFVSGTKKVSKAWYSDIQTREEFLRQFAS